MAKQPQKENVFIVVLVFPHLSFEIQRQQPGRKWARVRMMTQQFLLLRPLCKELNEDRKRAFCLQIVASTCEMKNRCSGLHSPMASLWGERRVTVQPVHNTKAKQEVHVVLTSSTAEVECPALKSLQLQLGGKKGTSATGFKWSCKKKKLIFRQKSVEASCCVRPSVAFTKSKLKSREKSCHKAAALSAIHRHRRPLLQICTFGCVFLIPLPYFPPSGAVLQFRRANVCHVINSEAVLLYIRRVCVC